MGFSQVILALVQPIIARILISLGLSVVSYVGMNLVMDQVISYAQGAWAGLPAGIIQLAGLAGVGQCLSIIFGAILTRVFIWNLSKTGKILSSNP